MMMMVVVVVMVMVVMTVAMLVVMVVVVRLHCFLTLPLHKRTSSVNTASAQKRGRSPGGEN